jgi:hypothetical protein
MGVESLLDGDIYSRIMLPFVEQRNRVFLELGDSITEDFLEHNIKAVHVYTLIQLAAFGVVFFVTQTVASIIFPVIILLLIPLRFRLLPRIPLFNRAGQNRGDEDNATPLPSFFDVMDKPLIFSAVESASVVSANAVLTPPATSHAVESGQYSMHEQNAGGAVVVGITPPPCSGIPTPPDLLKAYRNHSVFDSQKVDHDSF